MPSFAEIKAKLPSFLNITDSSNISKLVEVIFTELQTLDVKLIEIQTNRDIDTAFGNGLDKIGVNIGLTRDGLEDEDYREKLKETQALNRADGTIDNMISILQTQFEVENIADVIIEEQGDAKIRVSIPLENAVRPNIETTFELGEIGEVDFNLGLSDADQTFGGILGGFTITPTSFDAYISIVNKIRAAGVKAIIVVTGTFTLDDEDFGLSDSDGTVGGTLGGVV